VGEVCGVGGGGLETLVVVVCCAFGMGRNGVGMRSCLMLERAAPSPSAYLS
jgi:protein-tyrosine phosphatase